jgi:bifunctional non-homologous end joining protein LigD
MSLAVYKKKRKFTSTPEPQGGKGDNQLLRFVVQKHDASHLHYDFRLEMGGTLKSWAVPKGPSMDPSVKRLAMMVEDHPIDYGKFEGVIPEGNYGAGTVIVWDEGWYEPADNEEDSKNEIDKALRHQLHKGRMKFVLHGKKLKGQFALVKAGGRGENSWLLMKSDDKYASTDDILQKDKSVISRKTIEQMAGARERKPVRSSRTVAKKTSSKKNSQTKTSPRKGKRAKSVQTILDKAVKSPYPKVIRPMLATLTSKVIEGKEWLYEIKWDGYRAIAFVNGDQSDLLSRNEKSFNQKFYPIFEAIKQWPEQTVVDGEIVVLSEKGHANFGSLQNWRSEADGTLIYYVFDVLWLDGRDVTSLPLTERREILKSIIPDHPSIRLSEIFDSGGHSFFEAAKQLGLEGIIAKKADSPYRTDSRTTDWLKIKANKRHEVVIGGFTKNENSSKPFSSLLVGVYEGDELVYTGKIGTGFSDNLQRELMKEFKSLITKKSPFSQLPDINKPSRFRPNPPKATATWLKPKLVCEVSFAEMTSDGVMRHPSFEGMRVDKKAEDVKREEPVELDASHDKSEVSVDKVIQPTGKRLRATLLNPKEETQVREIDGHTLKFNNLSKIYWPDVRVTKRDMLNYYYQIAPFILPYLKRRPQSLNRFPNGINGKSFYQKDVTGKVPDWITTHRYKSSDEPQDKHFLVPEDEAAVLYMASLGCIELNPWSSTIDNPDNPDWCIIDLDPDKNSFDQVIEAARLTKNILDDMSVPCYCKTSGSTGLHIYIPMGAKYSYEQSKEFARVVATLVHAELPKFTSIERKVSDRSGKMYVDFLQNRPKATLAAPYSLRPKPGAPVSMPLDWSEVKKGLKMTDFTIFNAVGRVREVGDLFSPVLGKGVELEKIVDTYSER